MSKRYKMNKKDLEIIQEFVDNIPYDNVEYIYINKGDRYEVDIPNCDIYVGSKRFTRLDEYFQEWAEKKFGEVFNSVAIGILHEVGHIVTQDENNEILRAFLEMDYTDREKCGNISSKEHNLLYFELPSEIQATEWAVTYYREHRKEVAELVENLGLN